MSPPQKTLFKKKLSRSERSLQRILDGVIPVMNPVCTRCSKAPICPKYDAEGVCFVLDLLLGGKGEIIPSGLLKKEWAKRLQALETESPLHYTLTVTYLLRALSALDKPTASKVALEVRRHYKSSKTQRLESLGL